MSPKSETATTIQKALEITSSNTLLITATKSDDEHLTDQAYLNMSGEFVTVKGRKLRKSNKKESASNLVIKTKEQQTVQAKAYVKVKQQQPFSTESKIKSNLNDAKSINSKSFVKKEALAQMK